MTKDKKSKKEDLRDLHRILDDLSLHCIDDSEKKYLISLAKRIEENYGPIYKSSKDKKPKVESKKDEDASCILEPKVTIHHKEKTPRIKKIKKSSVNEKIDSEDLIEIEKVKSAPQEFIEIKPKITEEKFDTNEDIKDKNDLKEWEAIEEKEVTTQEITFHCPHCSSKLEGEYKFCPDCGKKTFLEELEKDIEKEEKVAEAEEKKSVEELKKDTEKEWVKVKTEEKKPDKKIESKEKEKPLDEKKKPLEEKKSKKKLEKKKESIPKEKKKEREEKEKLLDEKKKQEENSEKEWVKVETEEKDEEEKLEELKEIEDKVYDKPWSNIFKILDSVDEKIAELLYNNGITSIEVLKETTIKDLKKIHGIRGRLAKKIKSEVNELAEETDMIFKKNGKTLSDTSDEWEAFENKVYQVDGYTLYEKEASTKDGKKRKIRFFSKKEPDEGTAIDLPEDYEVKRNKRTDVPYLKKKK